MKNLIAICLFLCGLSATAQNLEPVTWTFSASPSEGNQYTLGMTAEIEKGWYLYSQHLDEGGPIPRTFHFEESKDYTVEKEVKENGAFVEGFDEMFEMNIRKYKELAEFKVLVESDKKEFEVKGYVEFMTCDDEKCLPPEELEFTFVLKADSK